MSDHEHLGDPLNARVRFLARALPADSFGGALPVGPLDVEGALARVLAEAARPTQPAEQVPPPRSERSLRWTTWVGAAMLLASFTAPWMVRNRVDEGRAAQVPSAWLAGVSSTSAVVFWTSN